MKMSLDSLIGDALRAVRNHKAEDVGDGRIFIPGARMFLGGVLGARYAPPGEDLFGPRTVACNKVVDQGLNKVLNLLGGHEASAPLYLAPFSGNVTPAADWTGANFAANATEFTTYTPSTRVPWTTVATTTKDLSNAAALAAATITFAAGGPYTIRGLGLLEASAKGATTGKCIVAGRFENDLTGMMGGGRLALEYGLQAVDEGDA